MFGYLFFPLTASECFCYTFYLLFLRYAASGWLWLPLLHVLLPLLASSCHWTHLLHVFSTLLHVLLLLDAVAACFTRFTSTTRGCCLLLHLLHVLSTMSHDLLAVDGCGCLCYTFGFLFFL